MPNPYDPPTVDSSEVKPLGRAGSYLARRKMSLATGAAYLVFCVGGMFAFGFVVGAIADVNWDLVSRAIAVLGVLAFPFFIGMAIVDGLGFGIVSQIAAGCVTAFIFAASIHLIAGWFIRRWTSLH